MGSSIGGDLEFSSFTDPCATGTGSNATVRTCGSKKFPSKSGDKWNFFAGFWYDVSGDGTHDSFCDGCIDDYGFVMP